MFFKIQTRPCSNIYIFNLFAASQKKHIPGGATISDHMELDWDWENDTNGEGAYVSPCINNYLGKRR